MFIRGAEWVVNQQGTKYPTNHVEKKVDYRGATKKQKI